MSDTRQMISARITVGIDLGDRYSEFCLVDPDGAVVDDGRLRTTQAALRLYFAEREPMQVVIEVGTHSPWVSRLLERCGHEVIVANPRRLRFIWSEPVKSDREDAERVRDYAAGVKDPELAAQYKELADEIDRVFASESAAKRLQGFQKKIRGNSALARDVGKAIKSLESTDDPVVRFETSRLERCGKAISDHTCDEGVVHQTSSRPGFK